MMTHSADFQGEGELALVRGGGGAIKVTVYLGQALLLRPCDGVNCSQVQLSLFGLGAKPSVQTSCVLPPLPHPLHFFSLSGSTWMHWLHLLPHVAQELQSQLNWGGN